MSANVEPHEARAILDAVVPAVGSAPGSVVAPRDFARPLRLSGREREELAQRVQVALSEAAKELGRALRGDVTLALAQLREESAEGLFDDLTEPFALVRFNVGGQPAWARWDVGGAVAAVEVALGAPAPSGGERSLSGVERRLLLRLLTGLVKRVAAALGLKPGVGQVVEAPEEAGAWSDGGVGADRARLRVHVAFEGPGGESGIDLWLPGVGSARGETPAPLAALPAHLDEVTVALSARLGACSIPLVELLALEEGDVIQLEAPEDGCIGVLVEDVPSARARLGRCDGHLALRIESIGGADDEPTPLP